jgi:uncharacterized protein (TIGR02594 family)
MQKLRILLIILILSIANGCSNKQQHPALEYDGDAYKVKRVYNLTPFEYGWSFYGEEELYGSRHNNVIVSFFDQIADRIRDDETPWCSAFMNHVHLATGYKYTGALTARSWLNYGDEIDNPKPGDIVVLWRDSPTSWKGHVGFFLRYNASKSKILVYGGNQNNKLAPAWYSASRLLGYRTSVYDYDCEMGCEISDSYISLKLDSITSGQLDHQFITIPDDE